MIKDKWSTIRDHGWEIKDKRLKQWDQIRKTEYQRPIARDQRQHKFQRWKKRDKKTVQIQKIKNDMKDQWRKVEDKNPKQKNQSKEIKDKRSIKIDPR